jgi:hypothetical protein
VSGRESALGRVLPNRVGIERNPLRKLSRTNFLKTLLGTSGASLLALSGRIPDGRALPLRARAASGAAASSDESAFERLATFGTAGKEGTLYSDRETELFRREGAGHLTHMWFGGDWPGYDRTHIRCYVDAEPTPSIDMELFLGHGIGWADPAAPWGTERLGKTGQPSGLYNTYQIPFGRSIRITGQLGKGVEKSQTFWWIVRGTENRGVTWGGMALPEQARLRLYVRETPGLPPLQMFEMAQAAGAGALCQLTLAVASRNFSFLEAMFRAYIDGNKEPLWLSSGTEDYFLGTYYFNRGLYHSPVAGLTHKNQDAGGLCSFSAYRFHDQDPIVFQKGLRLVWRNGEEKDGKVFGPAPPEVSHAISYAWIYEW